MSSLAHMDVSKQLAAFIFGVDGSKFLLDNGTNPPDRDGP
jgi:hypothetical protein